MRHFKNKFSSIIIFWSKSNYLIIFLIQYCFQKLIFKENKFSKVIFYQKYNKIIIFTLKNDYQRKFIFEMSHIFEDIIFSKKIQLLWNKNAFKNMFNKLKLIKKLCYLLHWHDYYVIKINNMIINIKKIYLYYLFFLTKSKDWLSGKHTNSSTTALERLFVQL